MSQKETRIFLVNRKRKLTRMKTERLPLLRALLNRKKTLAVLKIGVAGAGETEPAGAALADECRISLRKK